MSRRVIRILTAAAALALGCIGSHAHADVQTLARSGDWEAFGGTTDSGGRVCGCSTQQGRNYFGIKYFAGTTTLEIQLGTPDWKIENEQRVELVMRFDSYQPWRAAGASFHFADGDVGLSFGIKREELAEYLRELGSSQTLQIRFPDRGWPDWYLTLAGASEVTGAMDDCIRKMK